MGVWGAHSTFYNFTTGNHQLTKSGWRTELILLLTITLSHKNDEDHVRVESVPNGTYSREEEEEEEEERGQYLSHYR